MEARTDLIETGEVRPSSQTSKRFELFGRIDYHLWSMSHAGLLASSVLYLVLIVIAFGNDFHGKPIPITGKAFRDVFLTTGLLHAGTLMSGVVAAAREQSASARRVAARFFEGLCYGTLWLLFGFFSWGIYVLLGATHCGKEERVMAPLVLIASQNWCIIGHVLVSRLESGSGVGLNRADLRSIMV